MGKKRAKKTPSQTQSSSDQFELGFTAPEPKEVAIDLTDVRATIDGLAATLDAAIMNEIGSVATFIKSFENNATDAFSEARDTVGGQLVELQDKIGISVANAVERVVGPALQNANRLSCGLPIEPPLPPVLTFPAGLDVKACRDAYKRALALCLRSMNNDPRFRTACENCAWRIALDACGFQPSTPTDLPDGTQPGPVGDSPTEVPTDEQEPLPKPPTIPGPKPESPRPTEPGGPTVPPVPTGPPNDDEPIFFPEIPTTTPEGQTPGTGFPTFPNDQTPEEKDDEKPDTDNGGVDVCQPDDLARGFRQTEAGCDPPGTDADVPEGCRENPTLPGCTPTDLPDIPPGPKPTPTPPTIPKPDDTPPTTQECPICGCVHVTTSCPPTTTEPPTEDDEVPEEEEEPNDWCAWYDTENKRCDVSKCAEPPEGENWVQIGRRRTREAAVALARRRCRRSQVPTGVEEPIWQLPFSFFQCNVDQYTNPQSKFGGGVVFGKPSEIASLGPFALWADTESRKSDRDGIVMETLGKLGTMAAELFDSMTNHTVTEAAKLASCNPIDMLTWWGARLGIGFLSKWVTDDIKNLLLPIQYISNAICPMTFPTGKEAMEAFKHNTINADTAKGWLEINNLCPEPFERIIQARRERWGVGDLVLQVRRECITPSDAARELRGLGFMHPDDRQKFECLLPAIPSQGELIRFMVRDVEDQNIVDTFKLDQDFDLKFRGKVKDWARDQGVSEDVMRRNWRAHWIIPSAGQLFEMRHRLGDLPVGDPTRTSETEIRTALRQQDIPDFWIERFLAISFRRLTRVDTRRAFEIGRIDMAKVKEIYKTWGYSDDDAQTLADFAQDQKQRKLRQSRTAAKFDQGFLTKEDMSERLFKKGATLETVATIVKDKKFKQKVLNRRECAKGLKRRFLTGEFNEPQAIGKLVELGFDGVDAEAKAAEWTCALQARGKQPSTAKLCEWLENKTITAEQFVFRLENVGWTVFDANRLLIDCAKKINLKLAKVAEKDAKKEAMEAKRQKAAGERERAKVEKAARTLAKAREKAEQARDKREIQLVRAAEKYKEQEGIDLPTAMIGVRKAHTMLRREYAMTADEYVQAVVLAVEKRPKTNPPSLDVRARSVAESILTALKARG